MPTTSEIRAAFLDYFARNGHEAVSSSPLVPHNDPTLLFTNAGMVQFKNVFTGVETRPYKRAATAQKCLRAGGKHNDLDQVGFTARHHTFFEMLGNFSFGDYFKERAIAHAWELITKEYGVAKDRLVVTVYHDDEEAHGLWRKIAGLPEKRIIRISSDDNFWSMGPLGPCGPSSEIFYDHGGHIPGGPPGSAGADGDRFVEIWNLVFMQFEQVAPDKRVPLPKPSIDTGMGLERIAAVLQGKHDNYDTDGLRTLIEASAHAARVAPDGEHAVSHRVIADHLRASAFLIADGVLPSNEGRGYVLRRIMRRAMRHAHMMGSDEPLMWRLVPALVGLAGKAYPELARAEALISETLKLEETRFKQTLGRGLKLLDDELARVAGNAPLPGDVAFRLYDTYGFPLDLTQDVLRGRGRAVDTAGFDAAMERQRAEARKSWAGSGQAREDAIWFDLRQDHGATEFLGYATTIAEGRISALVRQTAAGAWERVPRANAGEEVAVVVNQTPFYGESGGQVGDLGVMFSAAGNEFVVKDTQRRSGDLFVHIGCVARGRLEPGDVVEMRVDGERRASLRGHHSATHLLHEALRRQLGQHVTQKGSLVAPDRLRFDVSHPKAISTEDLREIEREVNARVRADTAVTTRLMTPDAAVAEGAMALFGEKYGDEVRVVSMGGAGPGPGRGGGTEHDEAHRFSVELCGGTHVACTGEIGLFKIVGESAVGAGVRRIEALTGAAAEAWVADQETLLERAADELKIAPADLPARIAALLDERKKLERDLADLRRKLASGDLSGAAAGAAGGGAGQLAKDIAGVKFAARRVEGVPARELKPLVDDLKKKLGSGVIAVVAVEDGKASLVVGVTEDLTKRFNSVDLVRIGSAALGGKGGGGRPDMAQAGGPDPGKADDALAAIEQAVAKQGAAAAE
jgi:alanyl-tRNA synthetase